METICEFLSKNRGLECLTILPIKGEDEAAANKPGPPEQGAGLDPRGSVRAQAAHGGQGRPAGLQCPPRGSRDEGQGKENCRIFYHFSEN